MIDFALQNKRRDDERRKQALQTTRDIPAIYLPYSQRVLNPFPLASSGGFSGDFGQPWELRILAFYVSVRVSTTNDNTKYWTLDLLDTTGATLASVVTSALAANTDARLVDLTVTTPAVTNTRLTIRATATSTPGSIYILPAIAVLRT